MPLVHADRTLSSQAASSGQYMAEARPDIPQNTKPKTLTWGQRFLRHFRLLQYQ